MSLLVVEVNRLETFLWWISISYILYDIHLSMNISKKTCTAKTVKRTWIPAINILQPRHRLFFLALEHGDLGSLALCNLAHGLLLHHPHRFHCLHSGRFHGLHDGLLHCQCHGGAMSDSWMSLRAGCKRAAANTPGSKLLMQWPLGKDIGCYIWYLFIIYHVLFTWDHFWRIII